MPRQVCRKGQQGLEKKEPGLIHLGGGVSLCMCVFVSGQRSARGDTMSLSRLTAPQPQTTGNSQSLLQSAQAVHSLTFTLLHLHSVTANRTLTPESL